VGAWVGLILTHLWVYNGALDAAGSMLTLDPRGPAWPGTGRRRITCELWDNESAVGTLHAGTSGFAYPGGWFC